MIKQNWLFVVCNLSPAFVPLSTLASLYIHDLIETCVHLLEMLIKWKHIVNSYELDKLACPSSIHPCASLSYYHRKLAKLPVHLCM
jgi:hypothetical protein